MSWSLVWSEAPDGTTMQVWLSWAHLDLLSAWMGRKLGILCRSPSVSKVEERQDLAASGHKGYKDNKQKQITEQLNTKYHTHISPTPFLSVKFLHLFCNFLAGLLGFLEPMLCYYFFCRGGWEWTALVPLIAACPTEKQAGDALSLAVLSKQNLHLPELCMPLC